MEIAPLSKGAAVASTEQKPSVPEEPRLPSGRQVTSVQPHPTPIISSTPAGQNTVDDNAKRLHVAQMRSELTGTGSLVDVIA